MATFIVSFEETVKERVIALYARPKPFASSNVLRVGTNPGETVAAHAARLKSLLRSRMLNSPEQRARMHAVLAEQLMAAKGGGGPGRRNRRQRRRYPGRKPRRFLRRGERGAQGRARPCAPRRGGGTVGGQIGA